MDSLTAFVGEIPMFHPHYPYPLVIEDTLKKKQKMAVEIADFPYLPIPYGIFPYKTI